MVADTGEHTLRLADHFIGDEGALEVARCLKHGGQYTTLDLSGNALTAASATVLFEALAASDVRTVSLEWNSVGWSDVAIEQLAHALEVNSTITSLDLRNNHVGPVGAAAIARALQCSNTTLEILDLRWNDLGIDGTQALLEALKENRSLQEVRVEGNQACWDQVDELEAATRRNRERANTEGTVLVRRSQESQADELKATKTALADAEGQLVELRRQLQQLAEELVVERSDSRSRRKESDLHADQRLKRVEEEMVLQAKHADDLADWLGTAKQEIEALKKQNRDLELEASVSVQEAARASTALAKMQDVHRAASEEQQEIERNKRLAQESSATIAQLTSDRDRLEQLSREQFAQLEALKTSLGSSELVSANLMRQSSGAFGLFQSLTAPPVHRMAVMAVAAMRSGMRADKQASAAREASVEAATSEQARFELEGELLRKEELWEIEKASLQGKLKHALAATLSAEQALQVADQSRSSAEQARAEAAQALFQFQAETAEQQKLAQERLQAERERAAATIAALQAEKSSALASAAAAAQAASEERSSSERQLMLLRDQSKEATAQVELSRQQMAETLSKCAEEQRAMEEWHRGEMSKEQQNHAMLQEELQQELARVRAQLFELRRQHAAQITSLEDNVRQQFTTLHQAESAASDEVLRGASPEFKGIQRGLPIDELELPSLPEMLEEANRLSESLGK